MDPNDIKAAAKRELVRRAAKAELARRQQQAAPQQEQPSNAPFSLGGTASQLGVGVGQGLVGLASFPAQAGQWLGKKATGAIDSVIGYTPEQISQRQAQAQGRLNEQSLNPANAQQNIESVTGPWRHPQNTTEQYADTIGQFAPSALIGGAGGFGKKLLGATTGALGSETAGQLTQGGPEEPYARFAGAIAGGLVPSAMSRIITPKPISAQRQATNSLLAQEGVDLTAGQKTGGGLLRYAESELGGGKAASMAENQGEQFTKAALKRIGANANRATPDVMDRALKDIGKQFDDLANRSQIIPDQQFASDLTNAVVEYASITAPSTRVPIIEKLTNDLLNVAQQGVIDGKVYKATRSTLSRLSQSATQPEAKMAARDIIESLDDAMQRSNPGLASEWGSVRKQYRNYIVLEQAATGAGENAAQGLISPSLLRNATVTKQGRRNYARGKGDFADLARAGESTMKPMPNSGTSPRTFVRNVSAGIPAAVGALLGSSAGPVGSIAGLMAGGAMPFAAGGALMSRPVQAYLSNQILGGGRNVPLSSSLTPSLLGAASEVNKPRKSNRSKNSR